MKPSMLPLWLTVALPACMALTLLVPAFCLAQATICLRDVTAQTGITFQHTDGSSGRRYIVETVTAGLALFDYDGDGDEDIYFLNGAPLPGTRVAVAPRNALYRNEGYWRFTDVTDMAGIGDHGYALGVAVADYDNDGDPDVYVNNFGPNAFYRNNGDGTFTEIAAAIGVRGGDDLGAGACFLDIDRDGWLDLFIANGHLQDNVELYNDATSYRAKNVLLQNRGNDQFANVSDQAGDGLQVDESSRGAAFGDLDNDGDIDAVVLNSRAGPTLLRNDSETDQHWIQILLRGTAVSRDAVGSRVEVIAGDLKQVAEVHSGRGYQSHFGTRLHFGLGSRDRVDQIRISWIGHGQQIIKDVRADQCLVIVEGH